MTQQKHTQDLQNAHNSSHLAGLYSQINHTSTLRTVGFIGIDAATTKGDYIVVHTTEDKAPKIMLHS